MAKVKDQRRKANKSTTTSYSVSRLSIDLESNHWLQVYDKATNAIGYVLKQKVRQAKNKPEGCEPWQRPRTGNLALKSQNLNLLSEDSIFKDQIKRGSIL